MAEVEDAASRCDAAGKRHVTSWDGALDCLAVAEQSIDGEISLLWQDVDPYQGDVILMSLDTDEPLRMNTFEISGELAARLKDGVIEEGMRVRVHCRPETIEVVNLETGETTDEDVPVVVDVTVLEG
jgi:hypothetical protein